MHRRGWWLAVWAAIELTLISVSVVAASPASPPPAEPARQDNPTSTPTPTTEFFGPTSTVTPTLQPPPNGGGRVAVGELVVRFGPSQEWDAAGGLKYGDEVFPVARSVNGNWVAIDWQGDIGWILAELIVWDPDFQIAALPTLLPPSTPIGGFPTLTPTDSTDDEESTETPIATDVPASTTPSPELQVTDTPETVAVIPTATEAPVVAEAPDDPPQEVVEEEQAVEPAAAPLISAQMVQTGLLGLGGLILVVAVLGYGTRFVSRQLELRRYRKGFVIKHCPVCQQGTLELEEHVNRVVGIAHIQRSVRCDVCRSVLREVKPGSWRYTIDPYVNPDLAEVYNGQQFSDQELPSFLTDAAMYPPTWQEAEEEELDPEQVAQEVIGELEERFIEDRAAWEAEEAAKAAAEEAAATEEDIEDADNGDDDTSEDGEAEEVEE